MAHIKNDVAHRDVDSVQGRKKVLVGFSGKITLRDGTVLFAWRDRGIRGFPIYAYI